jgi:acetoin:2,6-dichlorophenolindophenol oxidoreductase subunit beta
LRKLNYLDAIREGMQQLMKANDKVFVYGEGIDIASGPFGVPLNLASEFGDDRIFDVPLSEAANTGVGIGAAINGMRPIMIHFRLDFILLTLDQIFNAASKMSYQFGNNLKCPFVIKVTVGRGWGQGPNHSQSFHSIFTHFPGMKVVLPSNPYDAKGLLVDSVLDDNPVLYVEHKSLYGSESEVPEEMFRVPIGKGKIIKKGKDVTILAYSIMVPLVMNSIEKLNKIGINAEVIDLRSSYPLDEELIASSLSRTGRVVIADIDWVFCGIGSEISAIITENYFNLLKAPIKRIGLPHTSHPVSYSLEDVFYPNEETIVNTVKEVYYYK